MATDYRLLNVGQLLLEIDSFHMRMDEHFDKNTGYLSRLIHYSPVFAPVTNIAQNPHFEYYPLKKKEIYENYDSSRWSRMRSLAVSTARGVKGTLDGYASTQIYERKDVALYQSELHKKFAYSFLLMMLFMIAAPLGAIIKKGGIGLPLVISVLLFVVFYAINITGEKMGKELIVPVWFGMWMSTLVLFPVALLITWKAIRDRSLFAGSGKWKFWKKKKA